MYDLVGRPDMILVWVEGREVPISMRPVTGYSVRSLPRSLDSWWIDIHRRAVPVGEGPPGRLARTLSQSVFVRGDPGGDGRCDGATRGDCG